VDRNFNPFERESNQSASKLSYNQRIPATSATSASWEAMYVGLKNEENQIDVPSIEFESDEVTGSFFEAETKVPSNITFQLQNKYIMSPIKSGLMVIHQNLAHQRVLYEELLKNITVEEGVSQQLLFPLQVYFSKTQLEILKGIREQLENTGFVFSKIEDDKLEISGLPVGVVESKVNEILEQLVSDIEQDVPEPGYSQNDQLAKSLAKSMAVKTGTPLNKEAREHLINQLFACKEPSISPNNSPVLLTMASSDFDKKFN
jgi:DNA mismatch repair protein MutL